MACPAPGSAADLTQSVFLQFSTSCQIWWALSASTGAPLKWPSVSSYPAGALSCYQAPPIIPNQSGSPQGAGHTDQSTHNSCDQALEPASLGVSPTHHCICSSPIPGIIAEHTQPTQGHSWSTWWPGGITGPHKLSSTQSYSCNPGRHSWST